MSLVNVERIKPFIYSSVLISYELTHFFHNHFNQAEEFISLKIKKPGFREVNDFGKNTRKLENCGV